MYTTQSVPGARGPARRSLLARRPAAVLALAALMIASLVTAATAQTSVQLNMTFSSGTRTLSVTDLSLAPLTNVNLVPNVASLYRVAVADSDYLTTQTFTVEAETGNLYLVATPDPTYDFDTSIASSDIALGVGAGTVSNLGIDLTPVYTLTAALGDCTTLLNALSLAGTDLLAVPTVCTQLAAAGGALNDVPIVGDVISDLDLTTLIDDLLGLADGVGGAFTDPSYLGIGASDPAATADPATTVDILTATPPAALAQSLIDAIQARVDVASVADVSSVFTTAEILAAMTSAGLGTLSATIGGLTGPAQTAVLDALLELGLQLPALPDLSNLTGLYTAIPSITAAPGLDTVPGTYSGTHTVRLVSP